MPSLINEQTNLLRRAPEVVDFNSYCNIGKLALPYSNRGKIFSPTFRIVGYGVDSRKVYADLVDVEKVWALSGTKVAPNDSDYLQLFTMF